MGVAVAHALVLVGRRHLQADAAVEGDLDGVGVPHARWHARWHARGGHAGADGGEGEPAEARLSVRERRRAVRAVVQADVLQAALAPAARAQALPQRVGPPAGRAGTPGLA